MAKLELLKQVNERTGTQNAGDCPTCSLVNYGRDCLNNPVNYADFEAVSGNDDKEMRNHKIIKQYRGK